MFDKAAFEVCDSFMNEVSPLEIVYTVAISLFSCEVPLIYSKVSSNFCVIPQISDSRTNTPYMFRTVLSGYYHV